MVTVRDGTKQLDFNNQDTFLAWANLTNSAPSSAPPLSAYVDEFKKFPMVDDVLVAYFNESTKAIESGLGVAPAILIGAISELLIFKLLKAVGNYLGDPNAILNYDEKKNNMPAKEAYTIQILGIGHDKLRDTVGLSQADEGTFGEFHNIVDHMFDSIRLRRNEIVHPKPELTIHDLPTVGVMRAHIDGFNPYAKVILKIVEIFSDNTTPPA